MRGLVRSLALGLGLTVGYALADGLAFDPSHLTNATVSGGLGIGTAPGSDVFGSKLSILTSTGGDNVNIAADATDSPSSISFMAGPFPTGAIGTINLFGLTTVGTNLSNQPGIFSLVCTLNCTGLTMVTGTNTPIKFAVNGVTTADMTLQADGTLSLGTETDSAFLLDVNGASRITGGLTLDSLAGTTLNITATTVQRNGNTAGIPRTMTAVYDPASLAAATARCDDITVTGITTSGGAVTANIGNTDPATWCSMTSARAKAADTVRICWMNSNAVATACDTASSTWTFTQAQ